MQLSVYKGNLMTEASGAPATQTSGELCRLADKFWAQDQSRAALEAAWAAFDLCPDERKTKKLLAKLLREYPAELQPDRRETFLKLMTNQEVEPDFISVAGWQLVLRGRWLAEDAADAAFEALITDLEHDELALRLLRQAPVCLVQAERVLSRLRRWLLLSGKWRRHPEIVAALKVQTTLNGGAWPFDEVECALVAEPEGGPMAAAYFLVRAPNANPAMADTTDLVTRAVAEQYEGWSYPPWTRITVDEETRLPDVIRAMDPDAAKALPVEANMLIAGCGTGREAASVALRYPDATVTAIDVSEASLDYARRQCTALKISNVHFLKLDLHDVARLNQRFHAVYCGGVLHHLPDPERGLNFLVDVLQPGGVMHIMVYSRLSRLRITGARTLIKDLLQQPVSDDLLRQVRQRFLQRPEHPLAAHVMRSRDFATLAGTYDLLLHRHEDPFDITRIKCALDRLGLRLLSFQLPTRAAAARYDAMFPHDPRHQDIKSWACFERSEIGGNYEFWCCQPHPNRS
jgi:ubiquinone/menaquinone biosynthesis C-methylase UbiE